MEVMLNRLLIWFLLGVGGALLPLLIYYLTSGHLERPNDVIIHGELFIVIAGMCAASLGELFGSTRSRSAADILAGALTVICLVISTALYTAIPLSGGHLSPEYISTLSYILFGFSLIACTSCIAISEAK
jgi:drug/metabolite transporter (DMT)-like permease